MVVQGTGSQNRVVGQTAAANTLTLNIASGTNLYRGCLGGDGAEENNLALVKKGGGLLNLTAPSNTYTGTTKIEAGVLQINSDQRNGGLITIDAGGTLGGTGRVGAITSSGTVSPGNSVGTLTSYGNVSLGAGATLTVVPEPQTLGLLGLAALGGLLRRRIRR